MQVKLIFVKRRTDSEVEIHPFISNLELEPKEIDRLYSWRESYKKIVQRCMKLTQLIIERTEEKNIDLLAPTVMNIITLDIDGKEIKQKLRERGWWTTIMKEGALRLVIMPHLNEQILDEFLSDLEECIESSEI